MKYLFDLLIMALMALVLCGSCATKKHFVHSSEITSSTDKNTIASVSASSEKIFEATHTKDTAITIAHRFVSGDLKLEDLKPLYTAEGKAVARVYEVKSKGLTSKLTVNPDNSIQHSAESDSMVIVIKNLVERLDRVEKKFYSKKDSTSSSSKVKVMTYKEFFKKSGGFLLSNWPWVIFFLVLVFLDSIINFLKRLKSKI